MNHSGKNQKSEEIEMADVEYQRTMKARISRITKYFPHNCCHLTSFFRRIFDPSRVKSDPYFGSDKSKKIYEKAILLHGTQLKICLENSKL